MKQLMGIVGALSSLAPALGGAAGGKGGSNPIANLLSMFMGGGPSAKAPSEQARQEMRTQRAEQMREKAGDLSSEDPQAKLTKIKTTLTTILNKANGETKTIISSLLTSIDDMQEVILDNYSIISSQLEELSKKNGNELAAAVKDLSKLISSESSPKEIAGSITKVDKSPAK